MPIISPFHQFTLSFKYFIYYTSWDTNFSWRIKGLLSFSPNVSSHEVRDISADSSIAGGANKSNHNMLISLPSNSSDDLSNITDGLPPAMSIVDRFVSLSSALFEQKMVTRSQRSFQIKS